MTSQNDALLIALRTAGEAGLTPLEALRSVGTMRLAARVAELRARGHDIETVRDGNGYATYRLHESAPVYTGTPLGLGI